MIGRAVGAAVQEIAGPPPSDLDDGLRGPPPPLHGGPLTLLRLMRPNRMLTPNYPRLLLRFRRPTRSLAPKYARPPLRLARRKLLTPNGRRLKLDGFAFIGPR